MQCVYVDGFDDRCSRNFLTSPLEVQGQQVERTMKKKFLDGVCMEQKVSLKIVDLFRFGRRGHERSLLLVSDPKPI